MKPKFYVLQYFVDEVCVDVELYVNPDTAIKAMDKYLSEADAVQNDGYNLYDPSLEYCYRWDGDKKEVSLRRVFVQDVDIGTDDDKGGNADGNILG